MSFLDDPGAKFVGDVTACNKQVFYLARQLPYDKITSYTKKENGRFKVIFEDENIGTVSHKDPQWQTTVEGVSIKVTKVVKGKMVPGVERGKGIVSFDSGCIEVSKPVGLFSMSASLLSVSTGDEKTIKLVSKLALIKQEMDVALSVFKDGTVTWAEKA